MARARVEGYAAAIGEEFRSALTEDYTPRQVAGSFALGTFVTMLPTLGTGLLLFLVILYVSDSVSEIALLASVLVFNPLVKWGVYAASFTVGVILLGPVEGVSTSDVTLSAGPEIVARLLVGNLLLAALATVLGYVVVYRLAVRYEASELGETIEEALEEVVEEALES